MQSITFNVRTNKLILSHCGSFYPFEKLNKEKHLIRWEIHRQCSSCVSNSFRQTNDFSLSKITMKKKNFVRCVTLEKNEFHVVAKKFSLPMRFCSMELRPSTWWCGFLFLLVRCEHRHFDFCSVEWRSFVCCHNEICLSKKKQSHSFEVRDKTSGQLIYLCKSGTKFVDKQLWNVAMITMFQWNFSLVLCLSLLVRWIFHSTRFNWVKKNLLSVKKRARILLSSHKSVWVKHAAFHSSLISR